MAKGRTPKNRAALTATAVKPPTLPDEVGKVWDATVKAQSPEWFVAGSEPLLEQYCRQVVYVRHLNAKRDLALVDPDNTPRDIGALSELVDQAARTMLALMRALRLTQQSRVAKETPGGGLPYTPWNDFPEDDGDTA